MVLGVGERQLEREGLDDRVEVVDALGREELVVAAQVAPVGAEGVGRQAALDREVV